jgi:hypothetical protein
MGINGMQRRFILELLADPRRNASAAYLRAGYNSHNPKQHAYNLLHNPEIQRAMEYELQRHLEKLDIDAEMVLKGIVQTIERAEKAGEGAWQMQTILKGYELLGRYLGMFKEQIAVGVDEAIMKQLELGRARAAGLLKEPEPIIAEEGDNSAVEEPQDDPKPN